MGGRLIGVRLYIIGLTNIYNIISYLGSIWSPCHTAALKFYISFKPIVYLTNRFRVAVCLFSYRSQMTTKCGKGLCNNYLEKGGGVGKREGGIGENHT